MSRIFNRMYVHLIWRTKKSKRILEGDLEQFVHRRIGEIAVNLRLKPFAINSAWDHIHILTQWNTTCAVEDVVREMKSRTSREWNELNPSSLYWQRGCGLVSIRHSEIPKIVAYIERQKRHHHLNQLDYEFETTELRNDC